MKPAPGILPLRALRDSAGLREVDVAALAGCTIETVRRLQVDGDHLWTMQLGTVARVALALGVAPVELLPELGLRPREGGELQRRGVLPRGQRRP